MVLLPLIVVAETWYDASTRSTWLYSEKLGGTPGRWGGLVCELREGEVEIGPGARHQNVFAVSPAPTGAVRIPESINGFSVASVGCSAFEDSALTAITFPSTVRYIGGWAVSGCKKLKSVTLPGSVVLIGEKAFDGCTALEKVSLSEGLRYIDRNAFDGCEKLATITLPDSLLAIEEDAFIDCRALKSIGVSQAHADRLLGLLAKSGFDMSGVSVRYAGEKPDVESSTLIPGEMSSIDTGLIGYTAKKLPSGLKYNKKTGCIEGAAKKTTGESGVAVTFTKKGEPDVSMTFIVGPIPTISVTLEGDTEKCKVTGGNKAYLVGKKVSLMAKGPKGTAFVGWFKDGAPWPSEEECLEPKIKYVMTAESLRGRSVRPLRGFAK